MDSRELQLFSRRDLLIKCFVSLPLFGLVWRLWNLQIVEGKKYSEYSKKNGIRLKSFAAPRGIIFDRNLLILAKNIPSFDLAFIREDCPDISKILRSISTTLHIPLELLTKTLALEKNQKIRKFNPINLLSNLTWYQMSLINAYQEEFPGTYINVSSRRFYPKQDSAVHVLGYVGKEDEKQKKAFRTTRDKSGDILGKSGVEKVFNHSLVGFDGGEQVEVDNVGRTIRSLRKTDAKPGKDIVLTIDTDLQEYIESILKEIKSAAIVMNPQNGEILSLASLPKFDPNEFSRGLSQSRWEELRTDPREALRNRATEGFSPGSTFKMLVAAAALERGYITKETLIDCKGYIKVKKSIHFCNKRSGHGKLNIVEALQYSCNVFFYELGLEMGIDTIHDFGKQFGFGKVTGVSLPSESSGRVPSKPWKMRRFKEDWIPGDTISVSIGQGYLQITPLQLLCSVNVFLNGGYLLKPRIVKDIISLESIEALEPEEKNNVQTRDILEKQYVNLSKDTINLIREGMRRNVQEKKGTGIRAKSKYVSIGGKTGTTQIISYRSQKIVLRKLRKIDPDAELPEKFQSHSWFVSYAPEDNPVVSTVVFLEHGGSGSNAAALTKKILEYYFRHLYKPGNSNENSMDSILS